MRLLPTFALAALAVAIAVPATTAPAFAQSGSTAVGTWELPPQLRKLGRNATYLAAGRRIQTTFADCKVRGGKFQGGDFGNAAAGAPLDLVAINVGGDAKAPACPRKGEVSGLSASGNLTVRKGPGTTYGKVDTLRNGRPVFFCDWSVDEAWVGVVYPDVGGGDCGVGIPQKDAAHYAGTCRSGWISARYVRVDD